MLGVDGAVALAKGVTADDERDRLLVVHRHASEGLPDVPGRGERIGVAVRALGVHVDEAHLHGAVGLGELPVAAVALVAQPGVLRAPEDLLRLPEVLAPEAEAKGLEAHRFQRDVASEYQQIGPGDLAAVLLLDRPQQPTRLVEAHVVRPAVERREALGAAVAPAPTVEDPVRTRGVPRQPDEERPVVAVVGRPPLLRGRHDLDDVLLQRIDVQGLELVCIGVFLAQRSGPGRVLVQHLQVQLIRPPVPVRLGPARLGSGGRDRRVLALADAVGHVVPPLCSVFLSRGCRSKSMCRAVIWPMTVVGAPGAYAPHWSMSRAA